MRAAYHLFSEVGNLFVIGCQVLETLGQQEVSNALLHHLVAGIASVHVGWNLEANVPGKPLTDLGHQLLELFNFAPPDFDRLLDRGRLRVLLFRLHGRSLAALRLFLAL